MIGWTEQQPDIGPRPLSTRSSPVAITEVVATPLLVWSDRCRKAIFSHLRAENFEQGGLLLGHVWHKDERPQEIACIDIVASVVAPVAHGTSISLAMGPELWDRARGQAQEGQHVVGWYHSHPGLGAFFSSVDRTTQAAFFRQPWQLGLVVDPIRDEVAWFRGEDSADVAESAIWLLEDDSNPGHVLD